MLLTWASAVRSVTVRLAAISRLVQPPATRAATWRSRADSPPYAGLIVRGPRRLAVGREAGAACMNCSRNSSSSILAAKSGQDITRRRKCLTRLVLALEPVVGAPQRPMDAREQRQGQALLGPSECLLERR